MATIIEFSQNLFQAMTFTKRHLLAVSVNDGRRADPLATTGHGTLFCAKRLIGGNQQLFWKQLVKF